MGVGFGHTYELYDKHYPAFAIKPAWLGSETDDQYMGDDPDSDYQDDLSEALSEIKRTFIIDSRDDDPYLIVEINGNYIPIRVDFESTYNGEDICVIPKFDFEYIINELRERFIDDKLSSHWWALLEDTFYTWLSENPEHLDVCYQVALEEHCKEQNLLYRRRVPGWCGTSWIDPNHKEPTP